MANIRAMHMRNTHTCLNMLDALKFHMLHRTIQEPTKPSLTKEVQSLEGVCRKANRNENAYGVASMKHLNALPGARLSNAWLDRIRKDAPSKL